jgi:uncharacterized protein CbrC (UPF0167 family)
MICDVVPEALPTFRYYRDPLGDETIEPSSSECAACGRARGFIVTSTAYGADVPQDAQFCPWCVADGTANGKFGAFFNEVDPAAEAGAAATVRDRTPGFPTWQDWSWPTHCGDVGVYLGQPSGGELRRNSEALNALLADVAGYEWGRDEQYMHDFIDGLGGSQVVYLFECPRCGEQLVRWDLD